MPLRLVALIVPMTLLSGAQVPLRFEVKRIEKRTSHCVITFEYPKMISAASPQIRDRINAGISRLLLRRTGWPAPDSGFRSLEAYVEDFIKGCTEFQTRPEARELYEHKRVTIFRYTPPILSFKYDATEDGGGAHPFGSTLFVNFEISTGKALAITDLVRQGALPKLESIAEEVFRRKHEMAPHESLSERSYSFPGGRFRLNDNFGIGETQLVFVFDAYEIGPGAMGSTDIEIPFPMLRDLFTIDLSQLPWF